MLKCTQHRLNMLLYDLTKQWDIQHLQTNICSHHHDHINIYLRGHPGEKPPPPEKATWQCKSKHKCIDFYPWQEVTPLERPFFWWKRVASQEGFQMTNCFTMFISSFSQIDQWLHITNACTFDLINWTNAGKSKNYNDATLNNNRLELIEQCVVKMKTFFVVIFQKTNKQKRSLTRHFVFLKKLSGFGFSKGW